MMCNHRIIGIVALCAIIVASFDQQAQAGIRVLQNTAMPRTNFGDGSPLSPEEPVLVDADEMDYDRVNEVVVAQGNVEIVQGETIMLADQLIYDRAKDLITAHGNISVMEPSGNVYFAQDLELKGDMRSGAIQHFQARLLDDSLMSAASARKRSETITELHKAVYSPCKVRCTKEKDADPLWQLRAAKVTIDDEEKRIKYDDAFFEVYGLPIFYSPYLAHPTPGAGNESGLLMPQYQHTNNLGSVYKQPVYYSIAPDKDVTITPMYVSKESPVMAGEYRQVFDSGKMKFDGSITNPPARNATGGRSPGNDMRGHFDAKGDFQLDESANAGFDIRRTSDDTYLRRYNFSQDTQLTSRAYVEDFNFVGNTDRNYAIVQGVSFQGLTAADKGSRIPYALPLADFTYQSQPGMYDSRFKLDAGAVSLQRQNGANSRRLSTTAGLNLPYISDDGQVIEFNTQMRTDIYDVDNVALTNGSNFDGATGRVVPEASVMWRYPFINREGNANIIVEPVVLAAISPSGGNPEKIPNEDSLVPEFTDSNLFSTNRFAGFDRIESGPRVSYGVRGQAQVYNASYVDWLVGQNYRRDNDRNFPFSNDLNSHFSDYVGKVGVTSNPFTLAYRFRLEKEGMTPKRNEVDAGFNMQPVAFNLSYLSLDKDPILNTKEVIAGSAVIALDDNWSLITSGAKDLDNNQLTSLYSGATYKNECINLSAVLGRDYTQDRDIESSTNFLIQISLKNLN